METLVQQRSLVSIIVPIYNVEYYLIRCLDSLAKQSLREIEVILVNDASPDQCGAICKAYVAKDERFKVFYHKEKLGLSAARNTGISMASSDYLMFVDSDDFVEKDFCKSAYECAILNNADMVMFNYRNITNSDVNKTNYNTSSESSDYYKLSQTEAIDLLFSKKVDQMAWNKLYKKALFQNISYPLNFLYEDVGTTYKIILNAQNIYYINKTLYNYCHRKGSLTSLRTKKALNDRMEMNKQQFLDLVSWGYLSENMISRLQCIVLDYCIRMENDFSDPNFIFCLNFLKNTKIKTFNHTLKQKILLFTFKYCHTLFNFVCLLWKTKYTY